MRPSHQYSLLLVVGLGVIAILALTFPGPVVYSLEKDFFPSQFHENTDALKIKELNSTADILPLMQDLLDYSGPIVLNIDVRDMDQARYYLDQFSKNNIQLKNLVVNLKMNESEMAEFSSSKLLQRQLLRELMNSTIDMDDLDSLMITYRDDQNMLISLQLQREAIRKKIHEISAEYQTESEKIQKISEKLGLDTTQEVESVREIQQIVDTIDKKSPVVEETRPWIPTLSLLVKPDTGEFGDRIGISGIYRSSSAEKTRHPVTIYIDNNASASTSTDPDGIYTSNYEIGQIAPGKHTIYATSGPTASESRTLTVTAVNSTTILEIRAVYNKPEIQCSGNVIASGSPVRYAPVDIISDYRNALRQTSDRNGKYQTQLRLSPGTHRIQAQFVNDTYPLFLSKSQIYLVEANDDSILSIRRLDVNMSADELSLALDPVTASYKEVISITGSLSGKNPRNKTIDLFMDGVFSRTLKTGPDGSYAEKFVIDKIRAGRHTVFSRYSEKETGEIYSESREIVIPASDTVTNLGIEMTDGGTTVICTGNVTARGLAASSVPVELVWDNRNITELHTDATGSFRQKTGLPVGNHSVFARFTSEDFPLNASRSITYTVTVLPPVDLYVSPRTAQYMDALTIGGSIRGVNPSGRDVRIFIDGKSTILVRSDARGLFSTLYMIENITAGEHAVQAFSGDYSSESLPFSITPVDSNLTLGIERIPDSSQVVCSGFLTENSLSVRNAPILIIWDDRNVFETRTNRYGRFEDTITLPEGKHLIRAVFNSTSLLPLNPSVSQTIEIDIPRLIRPGNLTVQVMPRSATFGEILNINGTLSAPINSGEPVRVFLDGRRLADTTTDRWGNYSIPYVIDRLSSGLHSVDAISGNFRSDTDTVRLFPSDSSTTLSLQQIPGSPRVSCSGTVSANNRSLNLAPVTIMIDGKYRINTETDESGKYTESIPITAGKHRIQSYFNSTGIFPVNPSSSIPVDIEITPGLSLQVRPSSGIYADNLTIEGTLISPESLDGTIDIFIDTSFIGSEKTDSRGHYTTSVKIEHFLPGQHIVSARSGSIVSDNRVFHVLPVYSQTSLTINKVNYSALYECTGSVMALDHAGDMIRKPVTVHDAELILAAFWTNPLDRANRPVRSAPVLIVSHNETLLETMTDINGNFSALVAFPEGDNTVSARFVNASFPVFSSESGTIPVNIPSANVSASEEAGQSAVRIPESLAIIAILFLFAGGAVYYLKRKNALFRERPVPTGSRGNTDLPHQDTGITDQESIGEMQRLTGTLSGDDLVTQDPIFVRYLRILQAEGLSTAARTVYLHFTGTIAQTLHIRNHRTLTPREFLRSCEEKPVSGSLSSFITIYEQIRYGGVKSPEKQGEFEESVRITDKTLEGEDH